MAVQVVYSDRLNKYFEIVEKIPDFIANNIEKSRIWFFSILSKTKVLFFKFLMIVYNFVLDFIKRLAGEFIDTYNNFVINYYHIARYSTIPLNKLWILGWIRLILMKDYGEPLDESGTHYIYALPGDGKSSLMFAKVKDYARRTGKASYINTKMEKPKYGSNGWYVNHRVFEASEFWQGGEQKRRFNTDVFCALVHDEIHFNNNQRRNKERAYNDIFIPMINSNVLMRHEGIHWILYASQMRRNDIQLMSLIKYYHKVKVKRGVDYKKWLKDGKFEFTVLGWRIKTYTVEILDNGFKLHRHRAWYKSNNRNYLWDFDTYAMKNVNDHLPLDMDWLSYKRRKKHGEIY